MTLEGLSTIIKHTKWTSALAHDEMNNEIMKWTKKWWNGQRNDKTLERLSKSVKDTKWPSKLEYDEINNEMTKWTRKWWNELWNDETLEGLSKSVKHTKWPSALAYDEILHLRKKGWVTKKRKCANDNVCGDNIIWG